MSSVQQKTVRNRILAALAPNDFAVLQPKLEPVQLKFHQITLEPGDPIKHVYFVERGITSVLADASEGRVEIGMTWPEGLLGLPVLLGRHQRRNRAVHLCLHGSDGPDRSGRV